MTTLHGDTRSHHYEITESSTRRIDDLRSGTVVTIPAFSHTETVSERYCRRCGWSEVRGVMGALRWHAEHDEHGQENR